jgi:hypothetical protein
MIMRCDDLHSVFSLYAILLLHRHGIKRVVIMKSIQSTIRQFKHESDTWKRRLEDLLRENVYLKDQLAERLNDSITGKDFLEVAEQYLNRFIPQDEIINLIRHDITVYDKLLAKEGSMDKAIEEMIEQKNEKMRRELQMLDLTFHNLKVQFNNFLQKV